MSDETEKKPAKKKARATEKPAQPAPRKSSPDLPELERTRLVDAPGSKRKVKEAFLVPGPLAAEYEANTGNKFICPAGPGMRPVPAGGQWYPVTNYLLRQVRSGALAEGFPKE
jgi:hypothetical protein